ncbi:acyltransferase [Actinotalea sp. BY-33]|uniref:Acyltransferase n=1 Tax=Actinotalea soli TaxID=2819234 RepID=A0A939LRQ3_9CELL|nr:acyltransferase [Actinotalea soli]MBO1751835.1 acyltransferase [Actinotalea soli]
MSTTERPTRVAPTRRRLASLDGLRGAAAVVVLVHHALLAIPVLARIQADGTATGTGPLLWLFTHTPLHLVWAGEEAVIVFFVLSGLVLTLPALARPVVWREYYPRRLVRLYLPVWGSLAVAVVLAVVLSGRSGAGRSTFVQLWQTASAQDAWHDALLLGGVGPLNVALWSLQWELAFSLLLPAFLLLVRRGRSLWPITVPASLVLIAAGTLLQSAALRYLPIFALGVILAAHLDDVERAARRIDEHRYHRLMWTTLALTATALVTARWTVGGLPVGSPALRAVASGASILGACLVVVLALHWDPVRRALEGPVWQWVGVRSFSLYLIHIPVIAAVALLLPSAHAGLAATLAIPVAVVLAALFYRLVERPAHHLSQRVGARAASSPAQDDPIRSPVQRSAG